MDGREYQRAMERAKSGRPEFDRAGTRKLIGTVAFVIVCLVIGNWFTGPSSNDGMIHDNGNPIQNNSSSWGDDAMWLGWEGMKEKERLKRHVRAREKARERLGYK